MMLHLIMSGRCQESSEGHVYFDPVVWDSAVCDDIQSPHQ